MEKIKKNDDCDNSKTLYKVMAYVKEFNSMEAKVVYYGNDREIAIEYVKGYSRSGTFVHLYEFSSDDDQ